MELNSVLCPSSLLPLSISSSSLVPSCLKCQAALNFFGSTNHSRQSKGVKGPGFEVKFDSESSILEYPDRLRTGEELSGESYNHLIREYCREGNVDMAMTLLAQLDAMGFHPSFVSYASLIEAIGSVGRTLEGHCLFQEMTWVGFEPKVKLYNVLLRGILKKGLLGTAVRVLTVMDEKGILRNRETYEILLDYYVKARRLDDTWSVINEMKPCKCLVNSIDTFGKYGDLGEALQVFEKMKEENVKPNITTWVLV